MPEQLLEITEATTEENAVRPGASVQAEPATPSRRGKREVAAHRFVDMWAAPGLHPTNAEVLQKLRMAEDRQFGANMDTCGTVSDRDLASGRWEKTHLIGIRTDIWKPSKTDRRRALSAIKKNRRDRLRREIKGAGRLSKGESKRLDAELELDTTMNLAEGDVDKHRLVLKLFRATSKNIRWVGSIEEVTCQEVHSSIGSKSPLLRLVVNLNKYDFLTTIEQNHRTYRVGAVFSLAYYDESHDRMWYVQIKRRWPSFGIDFVIEADGRRIGLIDGRLISLGRDAHIHVYEPALAADRRFLDLLTLFTASVGYHRAMRRHIRRRIKALRRGQRGHIIESEEFDLLRNPRKI